MKTKCLMLSLGVALLVGLLPLAIARDDAKQGGGRDYDALAQKLVTQCGKIQEGDLVQINGAPRDVELLENIAIQVRKVGAHPLITLGSDRLTRRLFSDVPAKFDDQTPEFSLKLAGLVNAQIMVDTSEGEDALAEISPQRRAASQKAFQQVLDRTLKRNVRQVYLGNGLYPTEQTAKQFGISKQELAKVFWDGLNVDYAKLQETGERLQKALAGGKELQILHPNGTDLRIRIQERPIFVSDGVLTEEKIKRGGPACQVWLPAGEVYLAPVAGTAEGKVVVERQFFEGKEIEGLTLTFTGGKLTNMTAKSGLDRLQAFYEALGPGKEQFSSIDIGINPNVRIMPGSKMVSYLPAGMISIAVGNNTWAGGDNNGPFAFGSFLPGCTLKIDDKVIVEEGTLKF